VTPEPEEPGLESRVGAIRAFEAGGRVHQTGIALVHEGEYIVPAPGSEAEIEQLAGGGGTVAYSFPIEIEVIGSLGDEQKRELADYVFEELNTALELQG
jgi:hypothetical protein